jgi:hypothetical protein
MSKKRKKVYVLPEVPENRNNLGKNRRHFSISLRTISEKINLPVNWNFLCLNGLDHSAYASLMFEEVKAVLCIRIRMDPH